MLQVLIFTEPSISSVSSDVPTAGGFITISGSNFGVSKDNVVVKYSLSSVGASPSTCDLTNGYVEDNNILCEIAGGVGKRLYVFVSTNDNAADAAHGYEATVAGTNTFGYAQPVVSEVQGYPLPTTGGELTIRGSNFGSNAGNIAASYMSGSTKISCSVGSAGDDYFVCSIPAGTGETFDLTVLVGDDAVAGATNSWEASGTTSFGFMGMYL